MSIALQIPTIDNKGVFLSRRILKSVFSVRHIFLKYGIGLQISLHFKDFQTMIQKCNTSIHNTTP